MSLIRTLSLAAVLWLSACGDQPELCEVCQRQIHQGTSYRVTLSDGAIRTLCCPRCGLHYQGSTQVVEARVSDYSTGKLIDAANAHFVESSTVIPCCSTPAVQRDQAGNQYRRHWDRCLPSLIAFADPAHARRFIQSKGGILKSYSELLLEETP